MAPYATVTKVPVIGDKAPVTGDKNGCPSEWHNRQRQLTVHCRQPNRHMARKHQIPPVYSRVQTVYTPDTGPYTKTTPPDTTRIQGGYTPNTAGYRPYTKTRQPECA
jgi:hypothetical protein